MARYRVAVIGQTGRGDYGHGLDVVWKSLDSCQIVAVADADPKGLDNTLRRLGVERGFADYRQMLDSVQPDLVAVAPRWIDQHRDMVVAAAERGAHVFMEKPFCRTLAEADEIIAACEKHKVKLAIAFQTRYSPKLRVIRKLIEDGAIGRLLELRGRGKEDQRGGGEDLWVLGTHILNLMCHFGGDPQWCYARVLAEGHAIDQRDITAGSEGIGPLAGDNLAAMYGLADGVTGYFASQRQAAAGAANRFGLRLLGTHGQIVMGTGYLPSAYLLQDPLWSPGQSGKSWIPVSSAGVGEPEPLADGGLASGNLLACQDLLDAIENDRHPEANMYEARMTVEAIASVFESHRQGKPVSIPLATRDNPLTLLKKADRDSEADARDRE